MPDQTAELIKPYLNPGEQVIWSGRPRAGIVLRHSDWFVIPFTLVWSTGAFAAAAAAFATASAPLFAKLFGCVFICAALFVTGGRFCP